MKFNNQKVRIYYLDCSANVAKLSRIFSETIFLFDVTAHAPGFKSLSLRVRAREGAGEYHSGEKSPEFLVSINP